MHSHTKRQIQKSQIQNSKNQIVNNFTKCEKSNSKNSKNQIQKVKFKVKSKKSKNATHVGKSDLSCASLFLFFIYFLFIFLVLIYFGNGHSLVTGMWREVV